MRSRRRQAPPQASVPDVGKRDNVRACIFPFRDIQQLQALLPFLYTTAPCKLLSRRLVLQPFRRAYAPRVHEDARVHEALRFRALQRHNVRRQYDDTRVRQPPSLCKQGVRRRCNGRQGHNGMVSRLQAALPVQRQRKNPNILSYRG